MPLDHIARPLSAAEVSRRAFGGGLLLFAPSAAARRLLKKTKAVCRECFDTDYPPHAHRAFDGREFLRRAEAAQKRVNSSECKPLFAEVLAAMGLDADELYWDSLGLRVAPPMQSAEDFARRGFRSHTRAHRDTWGAGFQAQVNWWSPVWPLSARRTMGFYPSYWRRPLENSSGDWSFKDFLASRKQCKDGRAAAYPAAPQPLRPPDETIAPLQMRPGEWLAFSAAHLHSSIANATSLTRFSLEIRTLRWDDLRRKKGAPNLDNESVRQPLPGLFSSVQNGAPLKHRWPPS